GGATTTSGFEHIFNRAEPPSQKFPEVASNVAKGKSELPMSTTVAVFTLRWYLRIAGIALIGYVCLLFLSKHPSFTAFSLVEVPLLVLGSAGIISSFFVDIKVVMGMISFLVALLSGVLLFGPTINGGLTAFVVSTSLDAQRAQLIAALLLTVGTALLGGVFGRRKLGACLGAGLVFWFGYLVNFIQIQLQPVHDPGGNLEQLNVGAFIHTLSVMGALALLSAFIGATVGVALSEVILNPPLQLEQFVWQRYISKQRSWVSASETPAPRSPGAQNIILPWLGTGVLVALFVLASFSSSLFIYSPDTGLHTAAQGQNMPKQGTVLYQSMVSQVLAGQTKPFAVYLPPSYNTPQGQNRRYPTLYLLHGSPGSYKDMFAAANSDQSANTLITSGKTPELIMILPDGNAQEQPSEWGNSYDHSQLLEDYVASELVKYVDQKFRTIAQPADRAIGGISMGGFGSMNIAVHHPDVFGTVIALGGYYQADGSVWGNNANYIEQNSPIDVLPNDQQARNLSIFLGAATQDVPYYSDTIKFAHTLDSLSIPYHLDVEKGGHSWDVWQVQIYNALQWIKWK
ncbi:MAG: alpha/beta hydrolase-fold protein, partial [Chloroflexota bacterium]|nr:alpha/beta hydrolase-fold protein [Chloroflexota bacterium]